MSGLQDQAIISVPVPYLRSGLNYIPVGFLCIAGADLQLVPNKHI